MHHSIVSIAVFVVLGVMVGWKLPYHPWALWFSSLLFLLMATWSYRTKRQMASHISILSFVVLLAALRCQMTSPLQRPDSLAHLVGRGRSSLELLVVTPVNQERSTFTFEAEVLSCTLEGTRYRNLKADSLSSSRGNPQLERPNMALA